MLHENEIDTRKVEDWSYRLRIAIEMTIDAHQFFAKTSKKLSATGTKKPHIVCTLYGAR